MMNKKATCFSFIIHHSAFIISLQMVGFQEFMQSVLTESRWPTR